MRYIIIYLFSFFILSCNSSGDKNSGKPLNDSTTTQETFLKIEPVRGNIADIPAEIKIKGNVLEVWKWKDKFGENLFFTSIVPPFKVDEEGPYKNYDDVVQTAELHAWHYVKKEGSYQQLWVLDDGEKACPFDITCAFIKDAVSVTDLDSNQIAETTVLYKLACRSDVSPSIMKLIMHEGQNKYSLNGLMWLKISPEDKFIVTENDANLDKLQGYHRAEEDFLKSYGRYENEKDFAGAPSNFITYARKKWMQFVIETFE